MAEEGPLKVLSSLRATRKLAEMFRPSVFRTLEIRQKSAMTSGMFILEKQPDLRRKDELRGISTSPMPLPLYPIPG